MGGGLQESPPRNNGPNKHIRRFYDLCGNNLIYAPVVQLEERRRQDSFSNLRGSTRDYSASLHTHRAHNPEVTGSNPVGRSALTSI